MAHYDPPLLVKNGTIQQSEIDDNVAANVIHGLCKNVSGGSLPKGTPVYQVGSAGFAITVDAADAGDADKMPAVGVLGETLADEAEGQILFLGDIHGVNTSAFDEADQIYVAVGGGYTNVKPTSPNLVQFLGIVTRVDATNGGGQILGTGQLEVAAGSGTVTSISTNDGITGGPITSSGTIGLTGQALALHNLSTNGLIARTGAGTVDARTITASTGISVSNGDGVSGNPTITNTAPDQTVVLTGGTGISTSGTYPNFTITNSDTGSAQNIFKNIAVSGQSNVVADSNNDTLTLAAGSNVTITTDATTDTITIASSGGGGGGINYQIITSSTTWEVPSGITRAKITVIGGGGGGSGNKTNSPQNSGAFGGNGGVAIALITDLSGSYSVTIGAGGTGGDGGTTTSTGGNGGNSSFGALLSATGGTGASGETSGVSGTGTVSSGTTIRSSAKGNGLPSEVSGLSKQGNANGGGSSASAYSVSAEYGAGHGGASANIISETPYTGGGGIGGVVIIEY